MVEYFRLAKILKPQGIKGEADISTMPVEYTDATPKYNASVCEQLGITPLDGYEAIDG